MSDNANGNGHGRGPLPFRPNVPIVGERFKIAGGVAQIFGSCNCGALNALLLVNGQPAVCPHCRTVYQIDRLDLNRSTGSLNLKVIPVGLAELVADDEAQPAPKES